MVSRQTMAGSARIPNEKKTGGKAAPPHFLFQLAAALDNPTIKSLEWQEDGKGILLHAKLYDEEIQRHQELFAELRNLKSVSVFQGWLATYGFKARMVKTDSDTLIFQHGDFKKLLPRVEETDGPKIEAPLMPKQSKKSKKRKSTLDITVAPAASTGGILLPESTGGEIAEDKGTELRSPTGVTSGAITKIEVDKSTQVDIDKMLSVCASHLVPPLSPQHK
ncbi:uncharacterized protein C16orf86 homolog isoform X3 [Rhineura floridana]|uniref:uncharacterized protein C16orf86 homolog isoform X3 n=1 Tax=Rhineura floridana TaxID=261503 RepID=UPI002AC84E42|nr:uncharacterized protein C16orf86 homolog isoform X3 [Rhineura floridana]